MLAFVQETLLTLPVRYLCNMRNANACISKLQLPHEINPRVSRNRWSGELPASQISCATDPWQRLVWTWLTASVHGVLYIGVHGQSPEPHAVARRLGTMSNWYHRAWRHYQQQQQQHALNFIPVELTQSDYDSANDTFQPSLYACHTKWTITVWEANSLKYLTL